LLLAHLPEYVVKIELLKHIALGGALQSLSIVHSAQPRGLETQELPAKVHAPAPLQPYDVFTRSGNEHVSALKEQAFPQFNAVCTPAPVHTFPAAILLN